MSLQFLNGLDRSTCFLLQTWFAVVSVKAHGFVLRYRKDYPDNYKATRRYSLMFYDSFSAKHIYPSKSPRMAEPLINDRISSKEKTPSPLVSSLS